MSPQDKLEVTKNLGSRQASSSRWEVESNHLNVHPFLVTSPRISFWHPRDIYARTSRSRLPNIVVRCDHVLAHLVLGCNNMAKVVVTRRLSRLRLDSN